MKGKPRSGWWIMGYTFNETNFKTPHRPVHTSRAPRALIVDDEVESIQPLQIVLTRFGFEVAVAFDGNEALRLISRKDFDLVFLDISMPNLSGPQVLEKFGTLKARQKRPSWERHKMPVITYSSYSLREIGTSVEKDEFEFIEHWQKPVSLPEIAARTAHLIERLEIKFPHPPPRKEGL